MMNINSGLAGLALLGGNSSLFSFGSGGLSGGLKIESRAVRNAREQFTLPETTPPWKMATATKSLYTQVEDVMRMRTVIDKPAGGARTLPDDVQTAFTAYKALDRLRALAELAAKPGAGESNRADYDKVFSKGLVDLENFLSTAPSDKLSLAFDQPVRSSQGIVDVLVRVDSERVVNRCAQISGMHRVLGRIPTVSVAAAKVTAPANTTAGQETGESPREKE